MSVKIAMISAGSIGFTRELLLDFPTVPELGDTTFAFTDIAPRNLERVCPEGRNWFESDFPQWLAPPLEIKPAFRSAEHASYLIEALETGRVYRSHFNVVNQGRITNLPADCVVEIPGYVDRTGLRGHLHRHGERAAHGGRAVSGNVTLLKQAMLHDQLVGAVCNKEVWQMTDEMLVAQAQWLPQHAAQVPAAKVRLAQAAANGARVKVPEGDRSAARLHTRTVEEMARDTEAARANAAASDKGEMTKKAG